MHICFICPQTEFYSPTVGGAIATGIMQKSRCLIARGHRVTVLAEASEEPSYPVGEIVPLRSADPDNFNIVQRGLAAARLRLQKWDRRFYEYYMRSFVRALRQMRPAPDAVICHNDFVSPKYIKRAVPRAKVIVSLHNEQGTRRNDLSDTLPYVDRFVTNSDYIRRWTAQKHNIPLDKLVVTLNGVDLESFRPRQNFLEPANPLRVLCIGRIDPNKGADLAADAVAVLRKEGLPVRLTIAGDVWFYKRPGDEENPFLAVLKQKIQAVDGDFLGHVPRPEVPALVRRHDVVCVLSRSNEPFGLVALEGMASGCAVVASNRGGLPEACGGAAWLVDVDNFDTIVEALRTLASIGPVLNEYKRRSIARAAKGTWNANVDVLEKVLQS
ncbi:MAG: glycosyltransferase family 4 protein [Tepidisphaeraceae bacterium]|jgi:glycosyltransferase involved in cell wall biosynthesis